MRSAKDRTPEEQKWRKEAALALHYAGYPVTAEAFFRCADDDYFSAYVVCSEDASHYAKPILRTCHCRHCPECERRAMALRFKKYMPIIEEVCNFGRRDYSLKHIVLTTPYDLEGEDMKEKLRSAWNAVVKTIESVLYEALKKKANRAERRRQRVSLRRHGMGLIAVAEFGEQGRKLHFHLLFYGPYIPKGLIPKHWERHTNGECKVNHIRQVKDAHDGAAEVILKYVTKFSELPPKLIPVLHEVLHGTRRIRSYGIFYNVKREEEEKVQVCPICGGGLCHMHRLDYELSQGREVTRLNLIPGNKSGEIRGPPGVEIRPVEPKEVAMQGFLPGMDALASSGPGKPSFEYN